MCVRGVLGMVMGFFQNLQLECGIMVSQSLAIQHSPFLVYEESLRSCKIFAPWIDNKTLLGISICAKSISFCQPFLTFYASSIIPIKHLVECFCFVFQEESVQLPFSCSALNMLCSAMRTYRGT